MLGLRADPAAVENGREHRGIEAIGIGSATVELPNFTPSNPGGRHRCLFRFATFSE